MIKTKAAMLIILLSCLMCSLLGFFVGKFTTRTSILNEIMEARVREMSTVPPNVPYPDLVEERAAEPE